MKTEFKQNNAKWVWATNNEYTSNCYALLSKNFDITDVEEIDRITISCSSFSEYKIYINERYIGRGSIPANYYYQYCDRYVYEKSELTKLLCACNNILIIAHHDGVGTHYRQVSGAGIIFTLEIERINGEKEVIGSDESWDAMISPCWSQSTPQMFWTTGFQEEVFLKGGISNYKDKYLAQVIGKRNCKSVVAESKDTFWNKAIEIKPHMQEKINILKKTIPHMLEKIVYPKRLIDFGECEIEYRNSWLANPADIIAKEYHIDPQQSRLEYLEDNNLNNGIQITTNEESNVFITLDFGTEVVGYPYFQFEANTDGIAFIGYSECLNNEGRVDPTRQGIRQADTIKFQKGKYVWEMFGRRAFRYMQITLRGIKGSIRFNKIAINHLYYPFSHEGKFLCNDEKLNRIYDVSKKTLSLCMKDNYEDCPLRERAQYIGDIKTEALTNYYTFGDMHLVKKGLHQFAQIQTESGWMKSIAPGSTDHNIIDYLPLWITTIREYYIFSGDRSTVEELYPNIKKLIEWLDKHTSQNGFLFTKPEWWIFIDWADIDKQDIVTALQCLFYKSLIDASYIAKITGHIKDAVLYANQAKKLRDNINKLLWDENRGAYVDSVVTNEQGGPLFSIQTNCLAVYSGVANKDKKESIRKFLNNWTGEKVTTGYFKMYELETYFRLGDFRKFFSGFDYWGKMLESGATTWWEVFDEDSNEQFPDCSLCHGWSTGPLYLLPSKILGIFPIKPGFKEFVIKPNLFGLREVYSEIATPSGLIKAEVSCMDSVFKIKLTVPGSLTAHIFIEVLQDNCVGTKINLNSADQRYLKSGLQYYKIVQDEDYCINLKVFVKEDINQERGENRIIELC